jgi:methylase of polypeptide subunit release factors
MPQSEADIHFELYRHLQNAIEQRSEYSNVTYSTSKPEVRVNGGRADIVLYDDRDRAVLVIEAKRPGSQLNRNIDPYSPVVIRQAFTYAGLLGAPFFATYNRRHFVVFDTFEEGRTLLERKTRAYEVSNPEVFASELLSEIDALKAGSTEWDVDHQAFINRLKIYHQRLSEYFFESLIVKLEDESFSSSFLAWCQRQGWQKKLEKEPNTIYTRFVSQASYLLMNRLVFYKLIEDTTAYTVPPVVLTDLVDSTKRRVLFDQFVSAVNFEVVYNTDPLFDSLELLPQAKIETEELLEQLESFNLAQFDYDILGQIYQRVIPAEERHDLGQYYTPPEVVQLIINNTVHSSLDVIMDPACGSGGFLVAAYARLKQLNPELSHGAILDQLIGYDVNRFAAHLSAINLALRDLSESTDHLNLEVEDFFSISSTEHRLGYGRVGISGENVEPALAPDVDVIVANPPYIRQELIQDKQKCRRHLGELDISLNKRSDIYVYFFTHASQFLQDGGHLGFITSDRWLTVGYGEKLQEFFLDNFVIKAIVNFSKQQFELALISTCVVLLQKVKSSEERDNNLMKMIQLYQPMTVTEITNVIEQCYEEDSLSENGDYRVVTLRQGSLRGETKWGRYLWAPDIYWDILSDSSITSLSSIASVKRGITSGKNSLFYFRDADDWRERGIPESFVKPLLKHISEVSYINLQDDDLTWFVLDLDEYIKQIETESGESNLSDDQLKARMRADGHNDLVDFIKQGEIDKVNQGETLKNRKHWFNIGELDHPPLILSEVYWKDCQTLVNSANAPIDKRLYGLWPKDGVDQLALAALLNSSIYKLMREMHGRTEQGEALDRNTLMVYEAKLLPIPNPSLLSSEAVDSIKEVFTRILLTERDSSTEEIDGLQRQLDHQVMSALGLGDRTDEIRSEVEILLNLRIAGGGQNTAVLVRTERTSERSLSGARRVISDEPSEQMRLDLD